MTSPTKPLDANNVKPKIYKARRQIVVSGGTLSSPLILQRSGIGMYQEDQDLHTDARVDSLQVTPPSSARLESSPLLTCLVLA